jgi:selenocysteine lyase/cysteine desulfurase
MSYKAAFRRFLEADPERVHFAAHSHHLWPDVSFDGHMQAWNDAAKYADRKWDKVFGEVIPKAAGHIARRLGLPSGESLAFAPNTHDFVTRILSCLPSDRPLRVLTTDSEFHSFARQAARLEEDGSLQVTRISTEPHGSFADRFAQIASTGPWDLVYFSHAFFNSGYVVPDLARCIERVNADAFVVVDGYHAFGAVPVDIGALKDRIFYVAGGYKYAMAGEGACFLHAPPGFGPRPRDTGWFAAFGALEGKTAPGKVPYAEGGGRFLGATFDPSALYRFNAVMEWLDATQLYPATIHAHVVKLEERFVDLLAKQELTSQLDPASLVVPLSEKSRGQFLTFRTPAAGELHARLLSANIITDVRADRLRFGFAIYHDEADISAGVARIRAALS